MVNWADFHLMCQIPSYGLNVLWVLRKAEKIKTGLSLENPVLEISNMELLKILVHFFATDAGKT